MAEYVVISFPGQQTAQTVLQDLENTCEFNQNDMEAAAIVSCDEKKCSLVSRSSHKMTQDELAGTMASGVTGMIIGTGIAEPISKPWSTTIGGGLSQAVQGDLSQIGIEEKFSQEVDMALGPDSSAICFLMWDEPWNDFQESCKKIIKQYNGTVLKTTLSVADEKELKTRLEKYQVQMMT